MFFSHSVAQVCRALRNHNNLLESIGEIPVDHIWEIHRHRQIDWGGGIGNYSCVWPSVPMNLILDSLLPRLLCQNLNFRFLLYIVSNSCPGMQMEKWRWYAKFEIFYHLFLCLDSRFIQNMLYILWPTLSMCLIWDSLLGEPPKKGPKLDTITLWIDELLPPHLCSAQQISSIIMWKWNLQFNWP